MNEQTIALIKALVTTLKMEVDTLEVSALTVGEPLDLTDKVRKYEMNLMKEALLKAGGNRRKAAYLLSIPETTLNSKMKYHNIQMFIYEYTQ